jgi:hypothetical protein
MNFVRLEEPSRRILVEIVVPSGAVIAEAAAANGPEEPAVAKEPEGEPQPQG